MRIFSFRTFGLAALVAVSGCILGHVGEAAALDRHPAVGGVVGSGSRGYGAERPGYGSEREYYGASNLRSSADRHRGHGRDRYRSHGSVIEFDDSPYDIDGEYPDDSEGGSRAGVYPGYGSNSFIDFGDEDADRDADTERAYPTGAKIIDVASERLDRYRAPKGSVSITYVGNTKIMRIGSGFGEPERPAAKPALAPWSDSWQRYCSRAFLNFDPERGTYTAEDGSTRFCTGD
ncbi:BA14K family protein [Aureimonas leprariae]|uniref:BA14K family protein n=1 Tax=Plantimonas leprariae TaxID=2615207 RepID=A0A7V7PP94_9HYPH|nr:BA14K family protein [Aureimonas leprariae]KAB0679796.1 BA14K family protein [Aureimonas leprariae]